MSNQQLFILVYLVLLFVMFVYLYANEERIDSGAVMLLVIIVGPFVAPFFILSDHCNLLKIWNNAIDRQVDARKLEESYQKARAASLKEEWDKVNKPDYGDVLNPDDKIRAEKRAAKEANND